MNNIEQELMVVATEALYMKPEMIKFLLVENLALKSLLHEKELITPEEFAEQKKKAAVMIEAAMKTKIGQQLKSVATKIPGNVASAPSGEASPDHPPSAPQTANQD